MEPGTRDASMQENRQVATRLDEVAQILEEQGANRFRIEAYRLAARTVRRLPRPVREVFHEGGLEALEALPRVGESLARSIRDLLKTGRLPMLERLRGEADPEALFLTLPGIGRKTAERLAGLRESLAQRLSRVRAHSGAPSPAPPVDELLDVDREYREKAGAGALPRVAPRRLNPTGEAWLPILHTQRGDRQYTALYSNTPRAHRLGTIRDWVVLYGDGHPTGQWTVITARHGSMRGRRIVRGREAECARHYGLASPPGEGPGRRRPAAGAPGRPGRGSPGGRLLSLSEPEGGAGGPSG